MWSGFLKARCYVEVDPARSILRYSQSYLNSTKCSNSVCSWLYNYSHSNCQHHGELVKQSYRGFISQRTIQDSFQQTTSNTSYLAVVGRKSDDHATSAAMQCVVTRNVAVCSGCCR